MNQLLLVPIIYSPILNLSTHAIYLLYRFLKQSYFEQQNKMVIYLNKMVREHCLQFNQFGVSRNYVHSNLKMPQEGKKTLELIL